MKQNIELVFISSYHLYSSLIIISIYSNMFQEWLSIIMVIIDLYYYHYIYSGLCSKMKKSAYHNGNFRIEFKLFLIGTHIIIFCCFKSKYYCKVVVINWAFYKDRYGTFSIRIMSTVIKPKGDANSVIFFWIEFL